MQQRKAFKYSILANCFIAALAIVFVAPLIVSKDSRSAYFWYRVVWTEVLNLLFWGSASFYILVSATQNDSVTRFGGVTPTIPIVTATYAIMSFAVMVIHALLPESDIVSRAHWILQIVLFAAAGLLANFLSISRAAATSALDFDRAKAITPKELHDLLAVQESFLKTPELKGLKTSINQLRDVLVYSLSETASLAELPVYQELSLEIKALCDLLSCLSNIGESQLNTLHESTTKLIKKAKLISTQQVRR